MRTFKMYWLESHNPDNWCDTKDHNFSDEEAKKILDKAGLNEESEGWDGEKYVKTPDYDEKYKLGVLNILASFEHAEIEMVDSYDGWIQVLAYHSFRAKNIENAKKIAKKFAMEQAPECEVFGVEENGNKVFDEQDIFQGEGV